MKEENARAGSKVGPASITNTAPSDGSPLFQGQKVTLDITTANLLSSGYTDVKFQISTQDDLTTLDQSKSGLVVLPGQTVDQTVTTANDYKLDVVAYGATTSDYTGTRWNVAITGGSGETLSLDGSKIADGSGDFGYTTSGIKAGPMFGVVQIPNNVTTFDVNKALKVNAYQISDASGRALTTTTFSAYVTSGVEDLTYFDFWDSNHNKLSKIQRSGKDTLVWIDSDATGKFTFYITCNKSKGVYSDTLSLIVGDQSPTIALVVAGDTTTLGSSAMLPAPTPSYMQGSDLILSDQDTLVPIDIPKTLLPDPFQVGDTLILIVNGKVQPNTAHQLLSGETTLPFPHFFTVAVSDLNVSQTGASNILEYINIQDNEATMSSQFPFVAKGSGQSGPSPQPPDAKYLPPEIVGNPGYLEIEYEDVANGLQVKIDWSGANWAPSKGDILKLTIQFDGWNWDGTTNTSAPVIPFDAVTTDDLNSNFVQKTLEYRYFAGLVENADGTKSKLFMQYYVPQSANNQAGWSLPTPWIDIDTVPPGGL